MSDPSVGGGHAASLRLYWNLWSRIMKLNLLSPPQRSMLNNNRTTCTDNDYWPIMLQTNKDVCSETFSGQNGALNAHEPLSQQRHKEA
jgi:hypothetical protein